MFVYKTLFVNPSVEIVYEISKRAPVSNIPVNISIKVRYLQDR